MRIFYHLSRYISHREAGLEYVACLRALGYSVATDHEGLEEAGLAILHDDPLNLPELFSRFPRLARMRTVAYAVWEGDILPEAYKNALYLVREIWTCSRFSQKSIAEHFPVTVVPHVVRRLAPSAEALARAARLVGTDDGSFVFFSVVDTMNPRKNVETLLAAFERVRRQTRRPVRLVLKQYRVSFDFSHIPGVVSLEADLPGEDMAALHAVTHAYVSAHHSEGWGLGLSASMAFGKPVIATGYSGNMEYMTPENSLPIPYALVPVSGEMCRRIPLFTPDMRWADIDVAALEQAMRRTAEGRIPPGLAKKAARITRDFGPEAVSGILRRAVGTR